MKTVPFCVVYDVYNERLYAHAHASEQQFLVLTADCVALRFLLSCSGMIQRDICSRRRAR